MNEINETLKEMKLKAEENFDQENTKIQLDNAMLECKVEEVEEEVLFLDDKIQDLDEHLQEKIKTKKENNLIYSTSTEIVIDAMRDYDLELSWVEEGLCARDLYSYNNNDDDAVSQ